MYFIILFDFFHYIYIYSDLDLLWILYYIEYTKSRRQKTIFSRSE